MNWKTKAYIQCLVGALPKRLREPTYYLVQRRFGAFRSIEPWPHLEDVGRMAAAADRAGKPAAGASVLDVGTGHRLIVPTAWWLLGARCVTTVDLHHYLRHELVLRDIDAMRGDPERVRKCLGSHGAIVDPERLSRLASLRGSLEEIQRSLSVTYLAPADAGATDLGGGAFDLHCSRSVFEHVPYPDLKRILAEARRLLRPDGLLVHLVDFSDHFAAADGRIATTHFLQYSDAQWSRLAGNQFAYHNRLRSDDFERLFRDESLSLVESDYSLDETALAELKAGFSLDPRFRGRQHDILARTSGLYVLACAPGRNGRG